MNSMTRFRAAALLCACIVSGIATANEQPTRTVNFADLNLDSPAGVTALYRRIERAADQVCVAPRDARQFKTEPFLKACRANAIGAAIHQIDSPALTALHRMKSGRPVDALRVADGR